MTLIKGWLLIVSLGADGMLAVDQKRNLHLSIERKHLSEELLEYSEDKSCGYNPSLDSGPEGNCWVRMEVWASCQRVKDGLETIRLCTSERKARVLPCRPNEGMWMNGVQYC